MSIRLVAAALLAACLATVTAPARAFVIENFAQGSFTQDGTFRRFFSIAGDAAVSANSRGFLAFDLAGAPLAASASITFFRGRLSPTDPLQTEAERRLALWAFGGDVDELINGGGGITAWNQLGSGTQIGSTTTLPSGSPGAIVSTPEFTVALSADFVEQFNALRTSAEPRIALGASFPDFRGFFAVDSFPAARLNITEAPLPVAEPTLLGLLVLSGAMLVLVRRRADARALPQQLVLRQDR